MGERGDGLGFLLEVFGFLLAQMRMEHLHGRLLLEADMLPEVDFGIATLAQQADEPVIAKLLSDVVGHTVPPAVQCEARRSLQVDPLLR